MRNLRGLAGLEEAVGTTLGTSDWVLIDQDRIDAFASATGDFQWIHVDSDRARHGPYGSTIAHGYLTLALLPMLGQQVFTFEGWSAVINYGADRVRFLAPVNAGRRVRARIDLTTVGPGTAGVRVHLHHTVEVEGLDRPACVADTIYFLQA